MRKFLMVVSSIVLMTNFVHAVKVDLTENEVKEAINWGAENRNSYENIALAYRFGEWSEWKCYKERGYIDTKFYDIACLGYWAGRLYKRPKRAEIEEVLFTKTFKISIVTYGGQEGFADDYHIVLFQGEKAIQPVSVICLDLTRIGRNFSSSLAGFLSRIFDFWDKLVFLRHHHTASVDAYFRYSDIDPKAKTTIVLVKDRGESRFEVDFSRYK